MFSRKTPPVTVSGLASELSEADTVRNQRISAAETDYAVTRNSVIERGTEQAANARRLEARAEAEELEAFLAEPA